MDWVRADDLDRTEREPDLHPEVTVLVEVGQDGLEFGDPREMRPELRRLDDYPEVEEAWLEYLVDQWEPWAKEMRRWQAVQNIYENLDFMRRRLEEAEERYELLLAVGALRRPVPKARAKPVRDGVDAQSVQQAGQGGVGSARARWARGTRAPVRRRAPPRRRAPRARGARAAPDARGPPSCARPGSSTPPRPGLPRIRHRFGISSSLCWYWTRIGSRYPSWVVRRYARRVFGPFQERLLPVHRGHIDLDCELRACAALGVAPVFGQCGAEVVKLSGLTP